MAISLPFSNRAAGGGEEQASAGASRAGSRGAAKSASERLKLLGLVFAGLMIAFMGLMVLSGRDADRATLYVDTVGQMRTLSQRIAKAAQLALSGKEIAFGELRESRDEFAKLYVGLHDGGEMMGRSAPALSGHALELLQKVGETWTRVDASSGRLLDQQGNLTKLNASVELINDENASLLERTEQLAAILSQGGASGRDLSDANRLTMLTQRIAKNANAMRVADAVDPEASFLLGKDTNTFREILERLK
ncbi:MAG: type IV pili methyl-accepting chemotaxis transducer N-terminal domain-containing protein, partial [Rhodocyclaceae bacterium]|nr:type IV pili methyl-accepting chemotaxis transducer N-terminal domain-containing protein [Rhodocyclaceae bacterium]